MQNMGKLIFLAGLFITLIGLIIWLLGSKLNWFGSLPGDVKIERENFRFYAPFMSMLLLSIFLSMLIWLINRFLR